MEPVQSGKATDSDQAQWNAYVEETLKMAAKCEQIWKEKMKREESTEAGFATSESRPTILPAAVLVVAMCWLHDRTAMEDQAANEAEPRGLLASRSPPPSSDPNEHHHGVKIDIHLAGDAKFPAHQAGVGSYDRV
jgi:hypothetical protein